MRNKCEPEGVNQCYLRFRLAGVFAQLVLPLRNTSRDDPSNRHFPREACTWSHVFVYSPAEEIPAGRVAFQGPSQAGKGRCTCRCPVQEPARLGRARNQVHTLWCMTETTREDERLLLRLTCCLLRLACCRSLLLVQAVQALPEPAAQQQFTSLTIVRSPSLKGARRGAAKGANTKAATAPAVSSSGAFKGGVCTS